MGWRPDELLVEFFSERPNEIIRSANCLCMQAHRSIMKSTAGCSSLYKACLEIEKDEASDELTKEIKVEHLFKKTAKIMSSTCYKCTKKTSVTDFCVCKRCEHFICETCVNNAHRKKCPACFMESVYHYSCKRQKVFKDCRIRHVVVYTMEH